MRKLSAALATGALLVALMPGTVAARPAVYVYHGTITGAQLFECTQPGQWTWGWYNTTGIWTATLSPGMAQISLNEFHDFVGDGSWVHWTAMGGAAWGRWDVVGTPAPGAFNLTGLILGMQGDVTLSDGKFLLSLEPYENCAYGELYGEVTWSNAVS